MSWSVALAVGGSRPRPRSPRLSILWPALVLAAAQAPLLTVGHCGFAGNKVEGLAWLKILGLVPTGVAPALWWLPDPAGWPLRVLPHYWTVDTLWRSAQLGALIGAARTALAAALPADGPCTGSAAVDATE